MIATPGLVAMNECDVCIIGGGMAGASVAYHLAGNASVVLLEREPQVGYHSTGRSAALFAPQYGSPVIRALTAASEAFFRAPPAGFSPVLSERGALVIGRPEQQAALAEQQAVALASQQTLHRLSSDEVLALVPALRREFVGWGLYDRSAMDMDVDALLQGYLKAARRVGLRVLTGHEVLEIRRGARWQVRTPDFELSARILINAAGAWADEIARLAGIAPLGLTPCRRTAFTFVAPAHIEVARWPIVIEAEDQFYFKPDAGRLLGSLSEEAACAPCDAQADDFDVAVAVDRIEAALNFPIVRVERSWAGLRTFGPDRNPISGFDESAPGFFWHAGLGGYGIQTSAALGAHAASLIAGAGMMDALSVRGLKAEQLAPARLR
jgi:D-arginine dehydrogenase